MTDAQLITIAITVLAVPAGSLFNNVRISDVNGNVNARFNSIESRLNSMDSRFNNIDRKLDEILHMPGNHETRIAVLEATRK